MGYNKNFFGKVCLLDVANLQNKLNQNMGTDRLSIDLIVFMMMKA
jgi:hypothetical protein